MAGHTGLGRQQTLRQLLLGHLQAKEHALFARHHRHIGRQVQGETGLTHSRAGADQDKVRLIQTGDIGIQQTEAGGNALIFFFVLAGELAQAVIHAVDDHLADLGGTAGVLTLANIIDLLLCRV